MAKRGLAIDIIEMIAPDKWEYKYDGETFTAVEVFNSNVTTEELEDIRDRWIRGGGVAKLDGNILTVSKVIPSHYAVSNLVVEGALQASIWGLITSETQHQVIADVCTNMPEVDEENQG